MTSLKKKHMEALKIGIESLQDDTALADVDIIINNRIFRCHKSILVAISPYFRAMFTTGMKESTQKRIVLQDIEETPFEKFRDFVYTGGIDLSDDDVIEILRLAALFQVDCLQEHCEDALLEQLKGNNCLEMYRLACLYNCKRLKKKSWPAILDGFCTVWKSEDFTSLSAEEIISIIREDNLVTLDEEHVCEAAMKWINSDLGKRKKYVYDIFKCIRLTHVTPEYLVNNLNKTPLLIENQKCLQLLEEAQHYHMLPSRKLDYSGETFRYRVDDDLDEVLLVVSKNNDDRGMFFEGGWCLWAFSYNQNKWFTLAPIQQADSPGANFALCSHGYDIFLSGGSTNPKNLLKLQSERNEWIISSGQLKKGRSQHCMVSVGNSLFCLGGNNARLPKTSQIMGSIEEYYIPGQKWRTVGELTHPVCSAAAAVSGEQILVFGGLNKDAEHVSFVQCFHSRMKESSVISNMPNIPTQLSSITIGKNIYVISLNEDEHTILKLTCDFGFVDAGLEITGDPNILGVSHFDGNLLVLTDSFSSKGSLKHIIQVDLETSQAKVLPMKGNGYPKAVHGCHRCYVDKRFLYHTYYQ